MQGEQHQLPDAVGERVLNQLAEFTLVLRRNAFTIGLKESEDAARILASGLARRALALRAGLKALFCAHRSDWDKFDALFDAHWLGTACGAS
jgi:uncharacterized protein with von Willebrand factor type A (vWA) domain